MHFPVRLWVLFPCEVAFCKEEVKTCCACVVRSEDSFPCSWYKLRDAAHCEDGFMLCESNVLLFQSKYMYFF